MHIRYQNVAVWGIPSPETPHFIAIFSQSGEKDIAIEYIKKISCCFRKGFLKGLYFNISLNNYFRGTPAHEVIHSEAT